MLTQSMGSGVQAFAQKGKKCILRGSHGHVAAGWLWPAGITGQLLPPCPLAFLQRLVFGVGSDQALDRDGSVKGKDFCRGRGVLWLCAG